jgi:hypothetical protein|tara:strand:+ start:183 stop:284 length:102 start_codon:yes stop_codon:yes gene_type:complete
MAAPGYYLATIAILFFFKKQEKVIMQNIEKQHI